jgi:hypothetical protein
MSIHRSLKSLMKLIKTLKITDSYTDPHSALAAKTKQQTISYEVLWEVGGTHYVYINKILH